MLWRGVQSATRDQFEAADPIDTRSLGPLRALHQPRPEEDGCGLRVRVVLVGRRLETVVLLPHYPRFRPILDPILDPIEESGEPLVHEFEGWCPPMSTLVEVVEEGHPPLPDRLDGADTVFWLDIPIVEGVCHQGRCLQGIELGQEITCSPELIVIPCLPVHPRHEDPIPDRLVTIVTAGRIAAIHIVVEEIDILTEPPTGVDDLPIRSVVPVV